jgi:hypothetical protein
MHDKIAPERLLRYKDKGVKVFKKWLQDQGWGEVDEYLLAPDGSEIPHPVAVSILALYAVSVKATNKDAQPWLLVLRYDFECRGAPLQSSTLPS